MKQYLILFFFLTCINLFSQSVDKLPNIIFILTDDMGYGDLKAFNEESKISTPYIDKLAAEGMMFTDAHVPGSSCITSRYGLLTGRYPFRAKSLKWQEEPLIDEGRTTIASILKEQGYNTGMVGKWHLGFDYSDYNNLTGGPADHGFDYYYGISRSLDQQDYYYIHNRKAVNPPTEPMPEGKGYGRNGWQGRFWRAGSAGIGFKHEDVLDIFTDKSIEFINDAGNKSNPFFLYLALASPHTPWMTSEEFQGKSEIGDWGDWVTENDYKIGKVIQAVYEMGIEDNTIIFFTSDNGPVWWPEDIKKYGHRATSIYRGMKFDAWEGGHRMPFIVSWPGKIDKGTVSDKLISTTDLLATFAELTGGNIGTGYGEDSFSFLDEMINIKSSLTPRTDFVGRPDNTGLFITKDNWKLINNEILINLKNDPSETNNLINEYPEKAEELKAILDKYIADGSSK